MSPPAHSLVHIFYAHFEEMMKRGKLYPVKRGINCNFKE